MANEKRLIDANAFVEALVNADADVCETYHDCYCEWGFSRKAIEDIVQNIPTVDVVPVIHGRWVMKETMIRSPFAKNAYCSECLEETGYAYNYCPNCGADMRERKDNGSNI